MAFTAKDVQALRQATNCGMMDCKKALTASDGDMDKAIEFLREKGLAAVAKKAGRIAAEGVVLAKYNEEKKIAAVVEVNSETDFVAKNADFIKFVETVADTVIEQNPADLDALMACKVGEFTIEEMLREKVLVIGENLKIRRFVREEGDVATYVHGGGKIGVMVKFETTVHGEEVDELGKDVAMQIAAINPAYLNREQVPDEVIAHEKEILLAQMDNDDKLKNKPAQIKEKMIEGKVGKYYKENCLLEQAFVKDDKISVVDHVNAVAKSLGGEIKVVSYVRFEKGEGLEKREDNFADEVASMMK